jgi:hypothetical protein
MTKPKKKTKKKRKLNHGFDNIPDSQKTIWRTDQFGKRKVIDFEKFKIIQHIDNGGLATDFDKKTQKFKNAITEIKRRLFLQIKKAPSSKKLYQRKTKKRYNLTNIKYKIDKMSPEKAEKMYFYLLKNHKIRKSRKK